MSVISFRYTVVSGLNPNALEPAYHEAAKAVLDGRAITPAALSERLKSIYVDDGKLLTRTRSRRYKKISMTV